MWGACAGVGHERELRGRHQSKLLPEINNNLQTGLVVKSWFSALPSSFPSCLCRMKNLQTHLSLAPPPSPPHIFYPLFSFSLCQSLSTVFTVLIDPLSIFSHCVSQLTLLVPRDRFGKTMILQRS